ncbi:hypothetical protein ACS86_00535 [Vibrio alginolyticus]|nr:hypothetical protein ACS86_00535 [Vibrio alginolyticus]
MHLALIADKKYQQQGWHSLTEELLFIILVVITVQCILTFGHPYTFIYEISVRRLTIKGPSHHSHVFAKL